MSDTPRTDQAAWHQTEVVEADFARQLERELAAALADAERYRLLKRGGGRPGSSVGRPIVAKVLRSGALIDWPRTESLDAAIDVARGKA